MPGGRRTGRDARRYALDLLEVLVVDAVDAQGALLHHADVVVVLAGAVRARPRAQLAADAQILVDQHDAILGALVRGAGRAHRDARRLGAVQARSREVHGAATPGPWTVGADLEAVDAVEPHAAHVGAVGIVVGQRRH